MKPECQIYHKYSAFYYVTYYIAYSFRIQLLSFENHLLDPLMGNLLPGRETGCIEHSDFGIDIKIPRQPTQT